MTARPTDSTTLDAARQQRVLRAERLSLLNRIRWAEDARDRAEIRILLVSAEIERLDRELVGLVGR